MRMTRLLRTCGTNAGKKLDWVYCSAGGDLCSLIPRRTISSALERGEPVFSYLDTINDP